MMKNYLLALLLLSFSFVYSQTPLYTEGQLIQLKDLAKEFRQSQEENLKAAKEKAESEGMPLIEKGENGELAEIKGITQSGQLIYYITDNLDAARTVSTDKVWPGGGLGTNLTGGSVKVGEWDGGAVLATHQELTGRITQVDAASSVSDHSTHVAGTMIASGVVAIAKGMAYTADLDAYDWNFDDAEMAAAAANGMLISNHSYGTITGWRFNSGLARWEWWGDTTISTTEDYRFGFYDFSARNWDVIAKNAPSYLIVKSAGNDRGDFFNGTYYNISSSSMSAVPRDPDGGSNGYDCISTNGTAKNILTVGAVDAIPSGYSAPSNVVMSSFSGWGPTDDGRIKPDIVANGVGVYSSLGSSNTAYASYNGTSMASPNTAGSLVLIQEHYQNEKSTYMLAATLKGLIIHTADEAGPGEGPDYQFGWGLLNTASAVKHITNANSRDEIYENTLNNSQTFDLVVTSDGLSPLMATICWTDEPGVPPAASLNPTTRMLVNDLDLRIIQNSNSSVNLPYTLNPASPASVAVKADNDLDNVEKVYIAAPAAGTYTIRVTHKGTLSSPQNYSLLTSGGITSPTPIACSQYINSFPYSENLESFTNCSTTPAASCNLPLSSGWQNATNDSIDWTINNGVTSTSNTGPSADFNPGTPTGKYLYLESSGNGNPLMEAVLTSPCFDLDVIASPEFSFAYHMDGSNMGSISVDVNSGISWTNLWFRSGDQGSGWQKASVDLSSYVGDTIQLRIRGITGNGELSDMAIDDFQLKNNPYSCNLTVGTFPYIQDFEGFTNCSTTPGTACILPASSGFENNTSDDIDWTTHNGATNSGGTGPTSDYNPGTSSGKYIYVEATAPAGSPNKEAILNGPCFDLTTLNNSELSFAYHMYGADMGYLYVDVDTGSGWSNEWFVNGDKGDQWNVAQIDLSDFDGKTIQIRIRGLTGNGYQSDIAIDNLRMGGPTPRIYCVSEASSTADTYISEVIFESISNNTSAICSRYSDHSDQIADLEIDSTYQLSITTGDCDGFGAYAHGVNVYIDWDNNGDFLGTGELVLAKGIDTAQTHITNVTVPSGAVLDSLRMRLVCSENLPIEPCGIYSYGETEDYTVVISDRPINDDCVNAIALKCGLPVPGSTLNANSDPGATGCGTPISAPGVWYTVIGNGQNMTVSTCGSAANFDTKLNVYTGVCGGLNCVGGNDNFCGNASSINWNSTNGVNYFVLVQGASGETGDFEIELLSKPSSAISASGPTTFCEGGSVVLSTDSLHTYQWTRNGSAISGGTGNTYNALLSGSYEVIVTDSNLCSDTTTSPTVVAVNNLPTVNISASGPTTFCEGNNVILSSTLGTSYQWYKNGTALTSANSVTLSVNSSGLYNVIVQDVNTCSDSSAAGMSISVNQLPTVVITPVGSSTICEGDSVQLASSGGIAYQWFENGNPITAATTSSYFASDASAYNVLVTNGNNCSDSASTPVVPTVNSLPIVNLTPATSTQFCDGDSLTISTIATGSFQWYGNGILLAGAVNPSFKVFNQGNYNVVLTDANNCSDSAIAGISTTVFPLPVVNMTTTGSTTFCDKDSVLLNSTTTGSYQWLKNGSPIGGAVNSSYVVYGGGNYNVEVTDGNNCSNTSVNSVPVTVNPLPSVSFSNLISAEYCKNDSTVLEASAGLSYQWFRDGNLLLNDTNRQLSVFESGLYNVKGEDLNGCSDTASLPLTILVNELPSVTMATVPSLCNTITSYTLTQGSPQGGTYSGLGVSNDSVFNPSAAGTGNHWLYYAYADPTTGCENTDSIQIEVVNCVGIEENSPKAEFVIFPNPTNGLITIRSTKDFELNELNFIDIRGRRIGVTGFERNTKFKEVKIDLNQLSIGVYFMELNTSTGISYHKIVIQ